MVNINNAKRQEVQDLLESLEQKEDITIIHAVESGSRAWGFPSTDSDYDIRIIYHHKRNWYISPFDKKDYIEIPITDDLDIVGWDISKALSLLHRGNATVHEWLNSPVAYQSSVEKYLSLYNFSTKEFDPYPAFHHYISLAKKKFIDNQTKSNAKAYLYGLRALLCAHWISDKGTIPPVHFNKLTANYLDEFLLNDLEIVLKTKAKKEEKDLFKIPNSLWEFSLGRYEKISNNFTGKKKQKVKEGYESLLHSIVI